MDCISEKKGLYLFKSQKHFMSNFVVSARKYRPIRFDSVVGQQHVTNTLKNAIQSDHLAQAFLFCGPRGVGKTTCARILAKVLNCESPTSDTEPCDECNSCKSFNENASLNIHELDAASNNSVEHIRALIEQVRFAPQRGRYKIYIIDEVHMLSQAAFNAFLKTLEEPPSYAIFILATTEKHKIIPTILSRCQIFDFNRIQIADMVAHLRKICDQEEIKAEEDALNIIAQKADGALRDALSIYDRIVSFSGNDIKYADVIENLNILDYDYYFKVVDAMMKEDVSGLMLLYDQIQRKGFDGDIFINGLAEHLRNLLVCQKPATIELLEVSGNIKNRYEEQAKAIPTALILSALSLAGACDVNYKMARNKRLHVEMALIKMAYIQKAIDQQGLAFSGAEKKNTEQKLSTEEIEADHQEDRAIKEEGLEQVKEEERPTYQTEKTSPKEEAKEESKAEQKEPTEKKSSLKERLRKKRSGGGNNILGDLMSQIKEEEEEYDKIEAKAWTIENVMEIWNAHIAGIDSPSTQVLFRTAELSLDETNPLRLKINVKSGRGQDAIQRDDDLLNQLRVEFRKPQLKYDIEIEEVPEDEIVKPKAKPVTDREKYKYFMEKNPLLADLQKRFGLYPEGFDPNKNKKRKR
jgi:DNA polymerase-3 subunit gamma/tau